jgi:ribosomal protein L24
MAYGHYKKHDKIVIVGGSYKGKEGVFIGLTGLQSARVKIDGDTVQERTIRLTSFKLAARPSTIEISLEDYETMKEEIAMLLVMVQRLQLKVESLNV